MDDKQHELIESLLVDEATEGLDSNRRDLLESLLEENPATDRYAFERAAATVFMAACGAAEQMPDTLGGKLVREAEIQFRQK